MRAATAAIIFGTREKAEEAEGEGSGCDVKQGKGSNRRSEETAIAARAIGSDDCDKMKGATGGYVGCNGDRGDDKMGVTTT
ncbi:hypothetical protein BHE74_00023636 [Ensete ventricosum]|nr:hypothetical protein BHE74_00023636 [Ensete ventricosum]RZR95725.1 hypothetical protein BHM03_00024598 [Ensete ventricosum]